MTLRVKNWSKFQHFKDRKPPWVKLYRDLLDSIEWHELDPEAAKVMVSLWLIASEQEGDLPDQKTLAFRLRITEKSMKSIVSKLSHWLDQDDITMISERYTSRAHGEGETETETETEQTIAEKTASCAPGFGEFWKCYPKKIGKGAAETSWKRAKINGHQPEVMNALTSQKTSAQWTRDNGAYIPNPSTWLNQRRWEDELPQASDDKQNTRNQDNWWLSDADTTRKANELGMTARGGESWNDFRGRIRSALESRK